MGCGCGAGGRRNVRPLVRTPSNKMPVVNGRQSPQQPIEERRHIERQRRDNILRHLGKPLML